MIRINKRCSSSDYFIFQEATAEASFTLTLAEPTYTPIEFGEVHKGTLTPDHLFDLYVFEAEEGDIPYAMLEADQLNLEIHSITDPEFNELGSNTPPGSTNAYISPRFLINDDQFFVLVSQSYLFEDKPYSLSLANYEPMPLTFPWRIIRRTSPGSSRFASQGCSPTTSS